MRLVFLKLGGSLITDKTRAYAARLEKLDAIASEIASVIRDDASLQLVLGHGSGSFGHAAASRYDTLRGVYGPEAWRGFAEVWYQASALDRLLVEALHRVDLPVVAISPAASVTAHDGKLLIWDTYPIQAALTNGLIPIIHGDVVFDEIRGGTILSTEELFSHLARQLHPQRILLAGMETGVWTDFPSRQHLLTEITPDGFNLQDMGSGVAAGTDVTGGMATKVIGMLALVEQIPNLEIFIFSGEKPGNLHRSLLGENLGTHLHR